MKYVRCLCFSVCTRLDNSTLSLDSRQRSESRCCRWTATFWRHPCSLPPPLRGRSHSSCCCLPCVWCSTWRDPSSPARTLSWSTRWKTVNWWDQRNFSPPPHCPVVCPLIELSTQLWRLWLRKSNLIKPKNRGGQCRLRFDQGTAREKKLFVFIYSIKFGSTAVKQCESAWLLVKKKIKKNQWLKGRASVRAGWRPWVAVRSKQNYLSAGDSQLVIIENSSQAPHSRRRLKDQLEKLHTKRQRKKMCKSKEFSFLKPAGFTVYLKCARFQITAVPRCNFKCLRSVIYP